MPVYTVHLPSRGASEDRVPIVLPGAAAPPPRPVPVTQAELVDAVFVPEGFSRAAFWLGPFWLAWHRLWLELLAWLVVVFVLASGEIWFIAGWTSFFIGFLLEILLGLEANNLRRAWLRRNGYRLADVAAGASRDDAERGFYRRALETAVRPPEPGKPRPQSYPASPQQSEVLGLFPLPEDPK